jgi:hypothetical protein
MHFFYYIVNKNIKIEIDLQFKMKEVLLEIWIQIQICIQGYLDSYHIHAKIWMLNGKQTI